MDKNKVKELLKDADICFLDYERNGCRDLISMGLQKLHKAQEELSKPDWVSVEDGLPEYGEMVWVCSKEDARLIWSSLRTKNKVYEVDENCFLKPAGLEISFTHWRPIEKLEE